MEALLKKSGDKVKEELEKKRAPNVGRWVYLEDWQRVAGEEWNHGELFMSWKGVSWTGYLVCYWGFGHLAVAIIHDHPVYVNFAAMQFWKLGKAERAYCDILCPTGASKIMFEHEF
jgi:hypothetical protein